MSHETSPPKQRSLATIHVASPCPVAWQNMQGDEKERHCRQCGLNVYNLSAMTAPEADRLLKHYPTDQRLCIAYYQRADGTMMHRDCPVGLRAMRLRLARAIVSIGALAASLVFMCFARTWKLPQTNASGCNGLAKTVAWSTPPPPIEVVDDLDFCDDGSSATNSRCVIINGGATQVFAAGGGCGG